MRGRLLDVLRYIRFLENTDLLCAVCAVTDDGMSSSKSSSVLPSSSLDTTSGDEHDVIRARDSVVPTAFCWSFYAWNPNFELSFEYFYYLISINWTATKLSVGSFSSIMRCTWHRICNAHLLYLSCSVSSYTSCRHYALLKIRMFKMLICWKCNLRWCLRPRNAPKSMHVEHFPLKSIQSAMSRVII